MAVRLIDNRWDLRSIQKLILLSSTYRQSSAVTPELLEIDPNNRYLARGPRVRLSGFVLRDQALAVSGLLVNRIGGPSAKPYMPPKIWQAISNNKYVQDKGENLFRRSLYTYWRRTIPPPTMMTFNAAAREVCTVRTEKTNTPLQALTLMNNKVFVESARFLAQRTLDEAGADLDERLTHVFRLVTARIPSANELAVLARTYDRFLQQFQAEQASATKLLSVGETPRNKAYDAAEHAALTMTASMLLNLDETITKE